MPTLLLVILFIFASWAMVYFTVLAVVVFKDRVDDYLRNKSTYNDAEYRKEGKR